MASESSSVPNPHTQPLFWWYLPSTYPPFIASFLSSRKSPDVAFDTLSLPYLTSWEPVPLDDYITFSFWEPLP